MLHLRQLNTKLYQTQVHVIHATHVALNSMYWNITWDITYWSALLRSLLILHANNSRENSFVQENVTAFRTTSIENMRVPRSLSNVSKQANNCHWLLQRQYVCDSLKIEVASYRIRLHLMMSMIDQCMQWNAWLLPFANKFNVVPLFVGLLMIYVNVVVVLFSSIALDFVHIGFSAPKKNRILLNIREWSTCIFERIYYAKFLAHRFGCGYGSTVECDMLPLNIYEIFRSHSSP